MSDLRLLVSVPDDKLFEALSEVPVGVEIIKWDMEGPAPVEAIDIVVPPYMGSINKLGRLENVKTRLVQSQTIGYDGVDKVLPAGHVFANASSVHETSTAELTLALILAAQRGIPDFVRAQSEGKWRPGVYPSVADRTVLLVGYGGVSTAIESRLTAFETTVLRVARSARSDDRGLIYSQESLPELLPLADIVVIAVPLTDETRHMVDDAFLSQMRVGSLLVNIARGQVADTEALLHHAQSGRLRLALDVTDPEPLPEGHPLYGLPNVLISPHVGGATSAMMPRMAHLVAEQIARILRGEDPLNVVLRT